MCSIYSLWRCLLYCFCAMLCSLLGIYIYVCRLKTFYSTAIFSSSIPNTNTKSSRNIINKNNMQTQKKQIEPKNFRQIKWFLVQIALHLLVYSSKLLKRISIPQPFDRQHHCFSRHYFRLSQHCIHDTHTKSEEKSKAHMYYTLYIYDDKAVEQQLPHRFDTLACFQFGERFVQFYMCSTARFEYV